MNAQGNANPEPKVIIVIPTYNERENIAHLVDAIVAVFKTHEIDGQILIVDDNSPDGTGDIADTLAQTHPVAVLHRLKDKGYGNSIIAGLKAAAQQGAESVITMDSDFSHDPLVIPQMLEALRQGNDVAIGSRRIHQGKIVGWTLWRHFCSSGARWFSSLMLGLKTQDITSGYRAYKTTAINKLPLDEIKSNGYSFLEEILYFIEKNGLKIIEVPITFHDRKYGKSKLSKKEILKFFLTMFRLKLRTRKRFVR